MASGEKLLVEEANLRIPAALIKRRFHKTSLDDKTRPKTCAFPAKTQLSRKYCLKHRGEKRAEKA